MDHLVSLSLSFSGRNNLVLLSYFCLPQYGVGVKVHLIQVPQVRLFCENNIILLIYIIGLLGILFDGEKREAAFSLLQGFIAVGFVISFTTALVLSAARQLWIIIVLLLISTLTYSIVFFKSSTKAQLIPCIYKEKEEQQVEVEDNLEHYKMEDINSNLSPFNPLSQRPSISVKEILEEKNSI